ncbi:MAG TPA: NTP transferase domain-containing protein [Acidimicrobiales bacterium]|nr:NTP transferase domain-containing protein [Acidimicrobiales bacterium]
MTLSAMVLAAGEGTRMRSTRPKPLHLLCGRPMLLHVLSALGSCDISRTVVVVGHGAEAVTKKVQELGSSALRIGFVEQVVQRGTGDAVLVGMTAFLDDDLDESGDLVVLPGDTPLLRCETVAALVAHHRDSGAAATLLTARLPDPTGYGRVARDRNGNVARVVEQGDASPEELEIDEVNTSIYCFRRDLLAPALRRLSPENSQGEYYLTDVVSVLHDAGYPVGSLVIDDPVEVQGVNDRVQLAAAEAELRSRTNRSWQAAGVTMLDPTHTYVDVTVELSPDVTLFPGTILQGATVIGPGAEIGPATRLVDTKVGAGSVVANTVARNAVIGSDCVVGPFAALDPGAEVSPGTRTGAFYTASRSDEP